MTNEETLKVLEHMTTWKSSTFGAMYPEEQDAISRALAIVKAAVKAKTTLRAYIDDFTMFDQLPIWRLLDALSEEVQTGG